MAERNMNMQIYYFSGTGNSLHAAEELQKRFPEAALVPMISALKRDRIASSAEIMGLIFPLHAFGLPFPVQEFLKRVDLQSASYIFAIATRGGSPCRVFKELDNMLRKKGKALDASFFIDMPSNYMLLPAYQPETEESLARYEADMERRLDTIEDTISHHQKNFQRDEPKAFFRENVLFPFIKWIVQKTRYMGQEKKFHSDPKCAGCGICQKVCLAEKIRMENGKPVWREDIRCLFCFACMNYCPLQAVQIRGTKTPERGRYHHPCADFAKIAGQKQRS